MKCGKGRWVVRHGEFVEIYAEGSGDLLASFKVRSDMCKEMFDMYLNGMHNVSEPYRIRKIKQ